MSLYNSPTALRLIDPLSHFIATAAHQYQCPVISDESWIHSGIERVIGDHRSGGDFIQDRVLRGLFDLKKSNYFESNKSERRYHHLNGICDSFLYHHSQKALKENVLFTGQDQVNDMLKGYHIYAGDGHFHAASSHDLRDDKGVKNAIGHLYALNLRSSMISHLALGSDGSNKKPHDMGVLKKLDIKTLRQGATKGQRIIYIWDRAGIDFRQWDQWKHNNGIYFISRVKDNMKLEHPAPITYDQKDPINAGIIADEFVGNSCGTLVRRIRFKVPETGEIMDFLTNVSHKIAPGIIAQLYFMRWRIEKTFDEIKNKLYETKAWAMSHNAKRMQAAFITLAYNLAQLLHEEVMENPPSSLQPPTMNDDLTANTNPICSTRVDIDQSTTEKRKKRLSDLIDKVKTRGDTMPLLRQVHQKASQLSVKFYRWLRHYFYDPGPWPEAQARLRLIYAKF